MLFKKCIIFVCLISLTFARSTSTSNNNNNNLNSIENEKEQLKPRTNGISSYMSDIKYLYKTYQDCSKVDTSTCLKLKLVSSMDSAFRSMKDVSLFDGVKFVKDESASPIEDVPVKTESQLEEELPRSLEDKDKALNGLIMNRLVSFFKTHTVQVITPCEYLIFFSFLCLALLFFCLLLYFILSAQKNYYLTKVSV